MASSQRSPSSFSNWQYPVLSLLLKLPGVYFLSHPSGKAKPLSSTQAGSSAPPRRFISVSTPCPAHGRAALPSWFLHRGPVAGYRAGRIDELIVPRAKDLTGEGVPFIGKKLEHQLEENLVTVSLDDINELFLDQQFDIYSDEEWDYMGESALDRIIQHMTPGRMREKQPLRLVIRLPQEKIVSGIAQKTEIAIHRWARQKIEDNHLKISISRWNGVRGLPPGLLFLASCLVIGTSILDNLGPYVGSVLSFILAEGVLIVGVVALETPVGAILYDHLPYKRENEVLTILMKMKIEILPQASEGS